jgi:hypothetical protein
MDSHVRNFHPRTLAMYQRCPTTDYELLTNPVYGINELARMQTAVRADIHLQLQEMLTGRGKEEEEIPKAKL